MFTKFKKSTLIRGGLIVPTVCVLLFLLSCRFFAWGKGDMISASSTWEALNRARLAGNEEDVKRLVTAECWSSIDQCILARMQGESRRDFLDRFKITEEEIAPPYVPPTVRWNSDFKDIVLSGKAEAWLEFKGYWGGNPSQLINELEFVKTSDGCKLHMWAPGCGG